MGAEVSSRALIEKFYQELDNISNEYEELTDTDVREAIHLTLNYFFVWGKKDRELPTSYSMFRIEGDRAVAQAVKNFLVAAADSSEIANTPLGQPRLDLLQNHEIETPNGSQYDEFIGHADQPLPPDPLPAYLFRVKDDDDQ
ncbi:MAG TPA: hypothetical protein VJ302_29055 [Blastocatellia bacterium]|nr:hypothetical protein [Blastocatellia bacterium]